MASHKHFQSDNKKYDSKESRTNIYNPEFNPTISAKGVKQEDSFIRNLPKWSDFLSWARWNPDLWYDLITPETGGIRLDLDQRVFLRSIARFISIYGVFPRGYGKTFVEDLAMYHASVFYPDIEISLSAQTKESASKMLEDKHREIIKFYPLMANEILKANFSKDNAEIIFTSGSRIDNLANAQSSKGQRRKRLNIEESNLLNNELFEDCLEPIPNVPRRTIGKQALINPEELNGQINFFTTSGFRGSTEFDRNLAMLDEMAELKGKIVIGADWQLACEYGRGETKSQILNKKERLSPIFFAMNYSSKWVGCVDDAVVDINKLLKLRVLTKPELKYDGKSDYYISMDIARSQKSSNNQSSIAVLKAKRNKDGKIVCIQLVNLINLPTGLNFTAQAIEFKRIFKLYNAKMGIFDNNGLGKGCGDELLKEHIDPLTGEILECMDTINTEDMPEIKGARKCIYALQSQGINSDIIVNFIDMVESGKLHILEKVSNSNYDINDKEYINNTIMPAINTDLFIEEVSNLKLKHINGGKLTVEQQTKRVDKDRFSAVSYGLWYIKTFEDKAKEEKHYNLSSVMLYRQPTLRK
jgi:ribonucleoside-diphosphate reductase alpha chain